MKLTFWGAARQVPGSMFLLELDDDYRILIECGVDLALERDRTQPTDRIGPFFPFEPSMVNLAVLTHAHIDHSGNLPTLVGEGYEGQILCTAPTAALTELLLYDSASLHQRILRKLNGGSGRRRKHRATGQKVDTSGLYLPGQVETTMERVVTLPFHKQFRVKPGLTITFIPAGHLLGAASVVVEVEEGGERKSIAFSGDIGRHDYPLLVDPAPLPEVDYLVCETTYGNRHHQDGGAPEDILAQIIRESCVDIPGRLIIPAFSVGRTQALLYTLNRLYTEHDFEPIKVFADSPLALRSTKVYQRYHHLLNEEARTYQQRHESLFDFENLHYVERMKDSRALSNHHEPCIIVSSSGMIKGGRIEHHMKTNLQNPYCTVFMIGYAAEGTVGGSLLRGEKNVRIQGQDLEVQARLARTDVFSGHGDLDDLLRFVGQQNPQKLRNTFLVHGEYTSMQDFRETLSGKGYRGVEIPEKGQTYDL